MNYSGNERRQNRDDHDLLTRIDEKLDSFISEVKQHIEDDKIKFKELHDSVGWIHKILYMALGIVAFIEFIK